MSDEDVTRDGEVRGSTVGLVVQAEGGDEGRVCLDGQIARDVRVARVDFTRTAHDDVARERPSELPGCLGRARTGMNRRPRCRRGSNQERVNASHPHPTRKQLVAYEISSVIRPSTSPPQWTHRIANVGRRTERGKSPVGFHSGAPKRERYSRRVIFVALALLFPLGWKIKRRAQGSAERARAGRRNTPTATEYRRVEAPDLGARTELRAWRQPAKS